MTKLDHYVFKTLLNTGNASNYNSILSVASMQSLEYRCEWSLSLLFKCIKENIKLDKGYLPVG